MVFAWKFILFYLMYIIVWVALWDIGFGSYYKESGYGGELNITQFESAISISYKDFVPASSFSETQLKTLNGGTKILANVQFFTGSANQVWIIYGYDNETWFECFKYWIYESGSTPFAESHICWSDITYVYSENPLDDYNITANTSSGQMLTASVTLTPTSLWLQITILFGFISGTSTFFSSIWWLGLFNFALFAVFFYCIIGEILIPFGIKIPFV